MVKENDLNNAISTISKKKMYKKIFIEISKMDYFREYQKFNRFIILGYIWGCFQRQMDFGSLHSARAAGSGTSEFLAC